MNDEFVNLSVLAVDDNAGALKLMDMALTTLGVGQVLTAEGGKLAQIFLEKAGARVDLVVCDWNMPDVTGLELLRWVRAEYPNMPFMMVTGNSDLGSVKEAQANGVSAYITKPYSPQKFRNKMTMLLRSSPVWEIDL